MLKNRLKVNILSTDIYVTGSKKLQFVSVQIETFKSLSLMIFSQVLDEVRSVNLKKMKSILRSILYSILRVDIDITH